MMPQWQASQHYVMFMKFEEQKTFVIQIWILQMVK